MKSIMRGCRKRLLLERQWLRSLMKGIDMIGEKREVGERLLLKGGVDLEVFEEEYIQEVRHTRVVRPNVIDEDIDREDVEKLIGMLHLRRFDTYYYWSRLCWILKSLGEEYYDLFLSASSKDFNFDERGCEKLLRRSDWRGLGMARV